MPDPFRRSVSSPVRPAGHASTMLASMALVEIASGFTQQYLSPLLPGVGQQSGITTAQLSWIFVVQQVSMAVLTPVLSRLGDNYGYRRILRLAVGMVGAGSLLMAILPDLPFLTLGAMLQGGVVGFMPLMIGILRDRAGDAASRRGIGLLVSALLLATGIGGLVSGAIGAHDPKLGLWVGVVAGVLGLVACWSMPDAAAQPAAHRFHLPSFALLAIGLSGVVLALAQGPAWGWASPATLGCGSAGVMALIAWPFAELRARHPMVDVRMFGNPRLAALSAVTFFVSFATIGSIAANATFAGASPAKAGYGLGLNPGAIGEAMLAFVLAGIAASALTPAALRRFGDKTTLTAAGLCSAVGFGGLALWHGTVTEFLILSLFNGVSLGIFEAATRALSVEAVPQRDTATAAGINELVLSLGSAAGAAVLTATLGANSAPGGTVTISGLHHGLDPVRSGGPGRSPRRDAPAVRPQARRRRRHPGCFRHPRRPADTPPRPMSPATA